MFVTKVLTQRTACITTKVTLIMRLVIMAHSNRTEHLELSAIQSSKTFCRFNRYNTAAKAKNTRIKYSFSFSPVSTFLMFTNLEFFFPMFSSLYENLHRNYFVFTLPCNTVFARA